MSGNEKSEQLANEILRQIVRSENARVLRAQPAFSVEDDMPAQFGSLLDEIDKAEKRQSARRH